MISRASVRSAPALRAASASAWTLTRNASARLYRRECSASSTAAVAGSDGTPRRAAEVESFPEPPRGLGTLPRLDQPRRDGQVHALRALRRLRAAGGVEGDPGLARPRPHGGALGEAGPARGTGASALRQRGLTQRANGHWKLPRNGTNRTRLVLERGAGCINMMAAVIGQDNHMAFLRERESSQKP